MINLVIDFLQHEVSKRTGYPYDISISVDRGHLIWIKLTNRVTHEFHKIRYSRLEEFKHQLDEVIGKVYQHEDNAFEPTTLKSALVCEHCKHVFDEKVMINYFSNDPSKNIILRHHEFTPRTCPRCGRYIESVEISSVDNYVEVHHN